jgi:hypothetical protein
MKRAFKAIFLSSLKIFHHSTFTSGTEQYREAGKLPEPVCLSYKVDREVVQGFFPGTCLVLKPGWKIIKVYRRGQNLTRRS